MASAAHRPKDAGIRRLRSVGVVAAMLVAAAIVAGCRGDAGEQRQRFIANGDAFSADGKFREALLEYRNAVQLDPMSGDARAKLARTYEKLGDPSGAMREFVRAADLLPEDIELQLTTVSYLIGARQLDDAVARVDAVLKRQPENVDAHVLRGNALGGLNNLDQALAAMEEALRLDPARGATHTQIGMVETARGRHAEAEAAFKRAVELAPTWIGGRLALANFYWAAGRQPDAAATLEAALAIAPRDESANHTMAVFALATGRIAEAERYLKELASLTRTSASQLALADYYIATRRSADAIATLQPLIAQPEYRSQARYRMARAHALAGDSTRAYALVNELLAEAPNDVEAHLLKGQLLLRDRRGDEAIAPIKAAVAAEPRSAAAQYMLGRVQAARGDTEAAEAAFREVLDINPSAAAAQTELTALHLARGTVAAALSSAESAVKSQPMRLEPRLALVRSLLASREFARAETELRPLLESHAGVAAVHVQHAVLLASRNQVPAARKAFEHALSLDPDSIEAIGGLLALDLNARDFATARARLDLRLSAGSVSPQLLVLAARTFGSIGDLAAAERTLRQAIQADATLLPAYQMLGQLYLQQNRLDEARREFETLAQKQANPASALTMIGLILQAQDNKAQARQRYERAVAADPRAAVAANNLAWLYLEANERTDEALRLARVAAESAPDSPDVLDTLGWAYYRSDLPDAAIPPLVRAVEKDPANAEFMYHLGLAYAKTGDPERARETLGRAMKLDGNSSLVRAARAALEGLEKTKSR